MNQETKSWLLSVLLALCLVQVCHGQFERVINSPPDVPPTVVASNTQLNLGEGAVVETLFAGSQTTPNEFVQVNLQGGHIEGILTVNQGAEVNIDDGRVNRLIASRDSRATIRGGELFDIHCGRGSNVVFAGGQVGAGFLSYGDVTISDGIFQGLVEASQASSFHVSNGLFSEGFIASIGSTTSIVGGEFTRKVTAQGTDITIAGGTFEEEFTVLSRDKLKIFGAAFLFDGEPIPDLASLGDTATLGRVILRGDVPVLNAILLDGNSLTIHLNRQEVPNQGWFLNGSTIDVTLAIPFEACDIDDDGRCGTVDLDGVFESIRNGDNIHDLDGNGTVDSYDIDAWLVSAGVQNLGQPYANGDVNLDGHVDAEDLNVVGSNWQMSVTGWASGDLNGDNFVNSFDLNILGTHWNQSTPGPAGASASVPEPSLVCWLWIATGLLAKAHRHR